MIDDFRVFLDNRDYCIVIVVDLLKVFDLIFYSLFIFKLKVYGFIESVVNFICFYLYDRL